MAVLALGAVGLGVYIISLVTGYTGLGGIDITVRDMTTDTGDFLVFADQGKFGLFVIILNLAPTGIKMAAFAFLGIFTHHLGLMRALLAMTTVAIVWGLTVLFLWFVAAGAGGFTVLTA